MVAYILYYKESNELKTKPAQNAVKQLMQYGIQPDLLFARTEYPINDAIKSKLSLYTNIPKSNISKFNIINLNNPNFYYKCSIKVIINLNSLSYL